jgi:gas vesicle protein GvpA/GvpJ/GvpM family
MARKKTSRKSVEALIPVVGMHSRLGEPTFLDIVDNVLNRGVVLNGELILGLANVDLICAKLSVLLAALNKLGVGPGPRRGNGPRRAWDSEPIFRPIAAGRRRGWEKMRKKVKSRK